MTSGGCSAIPRRCVGDAWEGPRVTTDVTVDDFLTGVIAGCRTKGFRTISLREDRFNQNIKASFDKLASLADSLDLDVRFAVFLDPLHRDSPVIERAVTTAVQRKLVSLDNPEFVNMRIKLDPEAAAKLLDDLPGGADLYRKLADVFVSEAPQEAAASQ